MLSKDVVAGLGEIGKPILQLISKKNPTIGYDINQKLIDIKKYKKYEKLPTRFLHVCIPYTDNFIQNTIALTKKFNPSCVVIHSTVKPYTTKKIHALLTIPVIYSATRGVHKRMLYDLKRYVKFYAIDSDPSKDKPFSTEYVKLMKKCGVKTKRMSNTITLELAKLIVDTSYYGWLINYAQLSNMIAIKHNVNYDEMWSFSDEIHKFLGNRPKMFPGFIGGHCVIPNLDLMHNQTLNLIKQINAKYVKAVPHSKSIAKKYKKS